MTQIILKPRITRILRITQILNKQRISRIERIVIKTTDFTNYTDLIDNGLHGFNGLLSASSV